MDPLLIAILVTLKDILNLYIFIIVVTVVLSWTPIINTKFFHFLEAITDPYLNIFRGLLRFSGLDFSPIIGILILSLLSQMISGLI